MIELIINKIIKFIRPDGVLTLQADITNACNLACKHCYHSNHFNRGALGLEEWKRVFDQYFALCRKLQLSPNLILCGGEPLLSPLLVPLITYYRDQDPTGQIFVLTNGTIYSEKKAEFLAQTNCEIQISIDGPEPESHNKIRGNGAFEKTVNNIPKYQFKGVPVHFLSILSGRTSTMIEKFFINAKKLGAMSQNFTRLVVQGTAIDLAGSNEDSALVGVELKAALSEIVSLSRKYDVPTATNQPLFHLIDSSLGGHDLMGFSGVIVDYKGNLKVSSRTDYIIGNVLEIGLENLFLRSPILGELRKNKIEKCGTCRHLKKCGGSRNSAFATYGSFLAPDPGCWL